MPHKLGIAMPRKMKPGSEFGERLTRLRTERALTQTQLAEMIESSQRAISAYETVAEFPPTPVVIKLAKALDVTTDELLGVSPLRKADRSKEDPEVRSLWKKFQKVLALPDRDRRAVVRLVQSLGSARAT